MKMIDFYAKGELTFKEGDRVRKKSGSSWHGTICGFYSSSITSEGYNVESEREVGSVQLYPVTALERVNETEGSR